MIKLLRDYPVMDTFFIQPLEDTAQVVKVARRAGIVLKQSYAKEGKALRRKAGGYAHAKQFKRMKKAVKRQRTLLGIVLREVERKLDTRTQLLAAGSAHMEEASCSQEIGAKQKAISQLRTLLERAERIRTQQQKDKNKLYALHAPEYGACMLDAAP